MAAAAEEEKEEAFAQHARRRVSEAKRAVRSELPLADWARRQLWRTRPDLVQPPPESTEEEGRAGVESREMPCGHGEWAARDIDVHIPRGGDLQIMLGFLQPFSFIVEHVERSRNQTMKKPAHLGASGAHEGGVTNARCCVSSTTDRVHCDGLSEREFIERYERPNKPVIIQGLADHWKAKTSWTPAALLAAHGNHKFKVGTDDEDYAVKVRLKYYLHYVQSREGHEDDSPLYIFDSSFADREDTKSLREGYDVPKYFVEDLFQYVGEERRPPYRWLVIGPPRSGTWCHIDPLATSAWNTLLRGRKRWALFPPGTPKHLVDPKRKDDEGVDWFADIYPKTQEKDWPTHRPQTVIQEAGETIFVPAGWYHSVLNLDFTIAVTQNFASTTNFCKVFRHSLRSRPKMARKWAKRLKKHRPDLAALAKQGAAEVEAEGVQRKKRKRKSKRRSHSSKKSSKKAKMMAAGE